MSFSSSLFRPFFISLFLHPINFQFFLISTYKQKVKIFAVKPFSSSLFRRSPSYHEICYNHFQFFLISTRKILGKTISSKPFSSSLFRLTYSIYYLQVCTFSSSLFRRYSQDTITLLMSLSVLPYFDNTYIGKVKYFVNFQFFLISTLAYHS